MKKENEWQHQYSVLSAEDRENPFRVLMYLRIIQPLFVTRNTLSLLFQAAMSNGNFPRETPEDRAKLVKLYFSLLRLIEVCYLIDELWENDKLTYHLGAKKKK